MVQNKFASSHPEFSPRSIVRTLTKHWVTLLAVWLLCGAITTVVIMRWPATYRAEALILVDSQKIPEKYVAPAVATDLQDRLATISQQILSSTQLKTLIDQYDLYRDEKKTLVQEEIIEHMRRDIGEIKVEKGWSRDRPGAFRIGYQGPVPTTVAVVATRLATLFTDENLKTRESQAQGTSDFLNSMLNVAKRKLDELEARVSKYKLEHNGELPQQEASLNGMLQRLQLELQGTDEAINRAQQTKVILENTLLMAESSQAALQRMVNEPPQAEPADSGVAASGAATSAAAVSPGSSNHPTDSTQLRLQLDAMRARYGEDYPDVKRLREEFERVKKLEPEEATSTGPTNAPPVPGAAPKTVLRQRPVSMELVRQLSMEREKAASVSVQLKGVNHELETRSADRKRILDAISSSQKRLERLPVREQEMEGITRDYENSKQEYRSLLEKKTGAEMAYEMERRQKSERFGVLEQAHVPELPISPKVPFWMTIGTILSLLLGIGAAMGMELRQHRLLGEWELPEGTVMIARVPPIDFKARSSVSRRWRLALVSSAVISLLGVIAVGLFYVWGRR